MGNDVTVVQQVRQAMDKMRPELSSVLPAHLPVEKFVRITQTALQVNPDLQECSPRSIISAATKCAEAGLQPDGEEAALVAYNVKLKRKNPDTGLTEERWEKQAKFLPMVRGIRNQVARSGAVKDWKVRIVYSQDHFKHTDGDVEQLVHEPAYVEGDHPVKVYSIAYLENGELSRHVMRMDTVNRIRMRSRSKDNGPWMSDTDEMIKKTCLKQHSKALPKAKDDLERQRTQVMLRALDDAEGVVDVENRIAPPDAPRLSHHEAATQRLRQAAETDALDYAEYDQVDGVDSFAPDNLPNPPQPDPMQRKRAPRKTANEKLAEVEAGRQARVGNGQPARAAAPQQQAAQSSSTTAPAGRSASPAPHAEPSSDLVDHFQAEDEALEADRRADDGRDYAYEAETSGNPEPAGFRDAAPAAVFQHAKPDAVAFTDGWDARFLGRTRVPPRILANGKEVDGKDAKAWMTGYDAAQKTIDIGNQPGTPAASRIMCDNMIAKLYP